MSYSNGKFARWLEERVKQRAELEKWLERHRDDPKVEWPSGRKLTWGERKYYGPPIWVEEPAPWPED